MIVFDVVFFIAITICLLAISISDYAKSEIPNKLSLGLLGLGLIYYFVNLNDLWYLPLISSLGLLAIFFIIFVLTGESAIGGGDMKVMCVSLLMFPSFEMIYNYLLYMSLFLLIGMIGTKIINRKEKFVKCGPYLSLALIFTLYIDKFEFSSLIIFAFLFGLAVIIIKYLIYWRKELYDKTFNQIFKV